MRFDAAGVNPRVQIVASIGNAAAPVVQSKERRAASQAAPVRKCLFACDHPHIGMIGGIEFIWLEHGAGPFRGNAVLVIRHRAGPAAQTSIIKPPPR